MCKIGHNEIIYIAYRTQIVQCPDVPNELPKLNFIPSHQFLAVCVIDFSRVSSNVVYVILWWSGDELVCNGFVVVSFRCAFGAMLELEVMRGVSQRSAKGVLSAVEAGNSFRMYS